MVVGVVGIIWFIGQVTFKAIDDQVFEVGRSVVAIEKFGSGFLEFLAPLVVVGTLKHMGGCLAFSAVGTSRIVIRIECRLSGISWEPSVKKFADEC